MSDINSRQTPFPPEQIGGFLRLCAGEWMSLRSLFGLGQLEEGANGDEWHSSERGDLPGAVVHLDLDPCKKLARRKGLAQLDARRGDVFVVVVVLWRCDLLPRLVFLPMSVCLLWCLDVLSHDEI